ncbi:acyl carrier protein [Sphingobacterium siyangense]
MEMQDFIEKFAFQLEDQIIEINAETNYVQSEFWDSLTAMVVKVMIEDEYGFDIPMDKLNGFISIESLFNYIEENKK